MNTGLLSLTGTPTIVPGQAQINLWFPYENLDFPLINTFRLVSIIWFAPFGTVDDIYSLLNANGYPTKMPSDGARYRSVAAGYLTNDPWVLEWDGTATVTASMRTAGISTATNIINANRIEYTYTGLSLNTTFQVQIDITALTQGSGFGNIRFFRKNNETALNNGERFDPNFIAKYNRFGRIRFMDWMATNGNPQTTWASRVTESQLSWTGVNVVPSIYAGIATQSGNDYTAPNTISGNPTIWTNGMVVQAVSQAQPNYKDVTGFSNHNPAQVTAVAHGFTTGNTVIFTSNSITGGTIAANLAGNTYVITVVDVDHFTLNSTDSTGWGTYASGGKVGIVPRFSTSTLPFKRIIQNTLDNPSFSGYPPANTLTAYTYDSDMDAVIYQAIYTANAGDGAGTRWGFPVETLVALANELKVSPWFCFPVQADDNYVTQFATYVRDNLSITLKANFEYSNEVWNTGGSFPQTPYATKKASLKGFGANLDLWYGYRFYGVMTLVDTVFAGQMNRINRVFSVFTANYTTAQQTNRFQAPGTGVAAFPITLADSLAIAPYNESDRPTTSNTQTIWNVVYGTTSQQTAGLSTAETYLRDDGWVGTGHVSGNTLTIDSTVSGTLANNQIIYGAGIPGAPSASPRTITGSGATWTISGASLGTIATQTFNTVSGAYTVKCLNDVVFPAWFTIASNNSIKLTQYEGGWGYEPSINALFGSSVINGVTISNTDKGNFYFTFYKSGNFAGIFTDNFNHFISAGGEYPSQYTLVGTWDGVNNPTNMWGMFNPNIFATPVPAYTSLITFNG